jgi:hypothetical protein
MKDDEMTGEMLRMLPSHISDESAVVLCNFLAELSMAAENRYFCKIRRYREVNHTTVDPDHPWESHRD